LIYNENFTRKSLPHIKVEYFEKHYAPVYKLILSFVGKYNKLPNSAALEIEFQDSEHVGREDANEVLSLIRDIEKTEEVDD
jgi:hypothetical protein